MSFQKMMSAEYAFLGMDMSLADYDGRTALHLAAAEGHESIIRFLLEKCKVNSHSKDRWNFTAYDDAVRFKHDKIGSVLLQYMKTHPAPNGECDIEYINKKFKQLHNTD